MGDHRRIDLDLWEKERKGIPTITVTGQGLRFEGEGPQFDKLLLILGGWMQPNEPT